MSQSVSPAEERIYHLFGVPLRTGSLFPGNENDAQAYRDVQIVNRFEAAGCRVRDEGDIGLPSYLPHHSIPPIKNWPGPRIAWDVVSEHITPYMQQPGHIPLLLGCDCSMVVGTTQALMGIAGKKLHILYIDGHIDAIPPRSDRCMSAAGMGLWLITHESPFWAGPLVDPSQITVVGWHDLLGECEGIGSLPLAEIRKSGLRESAQQTLRAIPDDAAILVHFDIDVMNKQDMPATYFPDKAGLSTAETQELLNVLLADKRIALIEVAEYAALRDLELASASRIIDLLTTALGMKR